MELRFRRTVAGLGGLALAAGIAAYAASGSSPANAASSFTTIAIATPAKTNDYGWNQQGYNAAIAAAKADGLKVKLVQNIGYNNTTAVLRELAQTPGVGFIDAHAS